MSRGEMSAAIADVLHAFEGSAVAETYAQRHGVQSAAILTVHDDEFAAALAAHLAPRITGRTVVEIGGGIGLLALHMSVYAKRVYCIEANPMWSWLFAAVFLHVKPKNVSYLFGAAEEFRGLVRGDVAIICTHSGVQAMTGESAHFAPETIDVYGEIITSAPGAFDHVARELRRYA